VGATERTQPGKPRKVTPARAAQILAQRDPVLARLAEEFGPPRFPPPSGSPFAALVRSVTYQQLAGAAASAIHGRLIAAMDGEATPERLLALPDQALRAAGLSARKVVSLRELASAVLGGTIILEPRRLARLPDTEVVTQLSAITGIGKWSAEIFLMFQLRRLDIWPTGDLGIRKGFAAAWEIPLPTPRQLDDLGEPFHPYRTVVAWYCWRAAQRYARSAASAVTA
jgi:DNA-3-methyladenine glycosylase II